jgi:4-diphosphocytidyl-2-C-methyl-D-erythritol kinase
VTLRALAPGKVNLCLFLGPLRPDGRHELVTLFESVSVADEVTVTVAPGAAADELVCPGVAGLNLVTRALEGLRTHGWDGPMVRVTIEKRIPVAGGMGGGSADAAALLRIAVALAPVAAGVLDEVAASLGADVPSQVLGGLAVGTGAGERLERREPLAPHAFLVVPQPFGLSTAEVYREADRLGLPRDPAVLAERLSDLRAGARPPFVNDLEPAALSLAPEIGDALDAVRAAGAAEALVSGSGPTVVGVYWGPEAEGRAADAAGALVDRYPGARSAIPVSEEFGAPRGS